MARNIFLAFMAGALFLIFHPSAKAQSTVISDSISILPKSFEKVPLIDHTFLTNLKFERNSNRRIRFGIGGEEHRNIILKLSASKIVPAQYLSIDNTGLDSVLIYRLDADGEVMQLYIGGRLVPFDTNSIFIWHTAPLQVENKPAYYLISVKSAQKNINFEYDISDYHSLTRRYERYYHVAFFYAGIAFMILSLIIIAVFLFRKKVLAVYAGYMVCISVWILDHYGLIFPFFYPHFFSLNIISRPISSLGAAFLLLTTQKLIFFSSANHNHPVFHVINSLRYFLLALLFFSPVLVFRFTSNDLIAFFNFLWNTGLIFSIVVISYTPINFVRTNRLARIFSSAMIVISIATLNQFFVNAGLINIRFLREHGMALGSLIENSIMAFGLLYGSVLERKNKNLQVLTLQEEKKKMLERLIHTQTNERKRIAADLHDNIGPLLAALKINFRRIVNMNGANKSHELIEKTEIIIDDSISEIRNVAHNLMPRNLEGQGLIVTLETYFQNIGKLYEKQLFFTHQVYSVFKPEIAVNIYFIVSELVLNAVRHSHAHSIHVSIRSYSNTISIKILDNGRGIPDGYLVNHHSFGIQSAQSRTSYLNGTFFMKSLPGKGTFVKVKIPL